MIRAICRANYFPLVFTKPVYHFMIFTFYFYSSIISGIHFLLFVEIFYFNFFLLVFISCYYCVVFFWHRRQWNYILPRWFPRTSIIRILFHIRVDILFFLESFLEKEKNEVQENWCHDLYWNAWECIECIRGYLNSHVYKNVSAAATTTRPWRATRLPKFPHDMRVHLMLIPRKRTI